MIDIDSKPIFPRFETQEQVRLRETRLAEWWLDRILEDRADCVARPPLELIEAAGHG
ncbi:MAG: hypothetical protein K2Y27_16295 [Xanthobacteraceae bacterium]|nr:hypothetical protein [Xanthobacteraceae bacterium]